ncbi:hypothetical protein PENFLA_c049G00360 [Penicillium flavigenum]|uniref:Reverse transcriptase Ty1/copia-type domain-containing protein n=1 Tax=Penicillium flavigenum TaxID=254877 RepID=A0A1V6SIH9_9EURO|nr:hypothetical protein PENFLA_c049G00360 [Penicillium flavigenum]
MAAVNNMIVEQVDYTAAYLNAMVDGRSIFMQQPTGFERTKEKDEVCLILQALYGLGQAGHLWYETLAAALKSIGFKPLEEEPCIWIHYEKQIWILYVDDTRCLQHSQLQISTGSKTQFRSNTETWGSKANSWGVCSLFPPTTYLSSLLH